MYIKNKKKLLVLSLVLIIALVGGISAFLIQRHNSSADIPDGIAGRSKINYDPPTDEEKAAGDVQKEQTIKQKQIDDEQAQNTNATIIITDSSYYTDDNVVEVRAYASNIFEDGGTCTATFTQTGQTTVTKTSQAFKDATSTQCGAINVPRTQFPAAGTWNVTVSYTSSTSKGQQAATVKL